MAQNEVINLIFKGKDQVSKITAGIKSGLSGLGKVAGTVLKGIAIGGAAVAGALVGVGAVIGGMVKDAVAVEGTSNTFKSLTKDIGGTEKALQEMREATRGMVKDADLMAGANQFLAMGITDTTEGTAQMAEMATQLGMAMGNDATSSMSDFAAMMANQSLPRLDTFGISSGAVRERILELTDGVNGLTREQAFNQAVMEQGAVAMGRVGEQGDTMQASMARISAATENAKLAIGNSLLPVLAPLIEKFADLAKFYLPILVQWFKDKLVPAIMILAEWIGVHLVPAIKEIAEWIKVKVIPALKLLAEWIKAKVVPVIKQLASDFMTKVVPALKSAYEWFSKNILPVLIKIGTFIKDHVLPVVLALAKFFGTVLLVAVKAIAGFWQKTLLPALKKLWTWLDKLLAPLGGISGAFDKLGTKIRNFTDKLKKINLPDWLRPGSPTPFEMGLRGIAGELKNVSGLMDFPGFNASVSANTNSFGGGGMSDTRIIKELQAVRQEISSQTVDFYEINKELVATYG